MMREIARKWLSDIHWFSRLVIRRPLHSYQIEPARAIVESVIYKRGLEFAVMFPRQSGKNETQSQLEAYLLNLFQLKRGAQIVKAQPTFRPQAINAMMRLESALKNDWNNGKWRKLQGFMLQLGQALIAFFSAEPSANVAGASATVLLEADEAQDIEESQWDKKFIPMGASQNVTIVYWGTAWTSQTLLAKTIRRLREQESQDGIKRVFIVGPERVGQDNPDYLKFVEKQVAKKGRDHPLIKTQFFNEEIDAEGGMFPPARIALMRGTHPSHTEPRPGSIYCFLIDVAGEDESATGNAPLTEQTLANPGRDSTTLTVVEIDLSTLQDDLLQAPSYRTATRLIWTGTKHPAIYGQIRALAATWRAQWVVVDATGVGAGLASFLDKALPGRVIPYLFNAGSKSDLGWGYLAVVETGRWKEHADSTPEQERFYHELKFCQYEARSNQTLKWGVPDGTRDPATGELVHDDTITGAALCSPLDHVQWRAVATGDHVAQVPCVLTSWLDESGAVAILLVQVVENRATVIGEVVGQTKDVRALAAQAKALAEALTSSPPDVAYCVPKHDELRRAFRAVDVVTRANAAPLAEESQPTLDRLAEAGQLRFLSTCPQAASALSRGAGAELDALRLWAFQQGRKL